MLLDSFKCEQYSWPSYLYSIECSAFPCDLFSCTHSMLYIEKTDLVRGTLGPSGSCPFTVRITAGRSKKLFDHLRVCLTVPLPKKCHICQAVASTSFINRFALNIDVCLQPHFAKADKRLGYFVVSFLISSPLCRTLERKKVHGLHILVPRFGGAVESCCFFSTFFQQTIESLRFRGGNEPWIFFLSCSSVKTFPLQTRHVMFQPVSSFCRNYTCTNEP